MEIQDSDTEIGIVIPIYQKKFIKKLINTINKIGSKRKFIICIVNDGILDVKKYLEKNSWPNNVIILNLSQNMQFAGANNAGWAELISYYPKLKYLGTLNDDTIPRNGWLDELINTLERNPQAALAGPIMETKKNWLFGKKNYAILRYKHDTSAEWIKNDIYQDELVPFIGGFCFMGRREMIEEVGGFDERYKNSCEDIDLCLKLLSKKKKLIVSAKSRVFHYVTSSRGLKDTNTDIIASHKLISEKWGNDLSIYNNF